MKTKWVLTGAALSGGLAWAAIRNARSIDCKNKVVLITGGSRGLGIELARQFGEQGAKLAILARGQAGLDHARADLEARQYEVFTIQCDVSDREQAEHAVKQTLAHFGRLDILVNNAGVIQVGPLQNLPVEDFERAMGVMFWGTVYTTLAALPHLHRAPGARIVNITSIGGKVSIPHLLPYSCAKFAAVAFSEGLRAELFRTGIRVVTIAPGLMRTGSYLNALFKGQVEKEAAWFSTGASLPGFSIGAASAAKQIVAATRRGTAEKILTVPAAALAKFHGLFPGFTADVLGLVNRLLPDGGSEIKVGSEVESLHQSWLKVITLPGQYAARRYLQPAAR